MLLTLATASFHTLENPPTGASYLEPWSPQPKGAPSRTLGASRTAALASSILGRGQLSSKLAALWKAPESDKKGTVFVAEVALVTGSQSEHSSTSQPSPPPPPPALHEWKGQELGLPRGEQTGGISNWTTNASPPRTGSHTASSVTQIPRGKKNQTRGEKKT